MALERSRTVYGRSLILVVGCWASFARLTSPRIGARASVTFRGGCASMAAGALVPFRADPVTPNRRSFRLDAALKRLLQPLDQLVDLIAGRVMNERHPQYTNRRLDAHRVKRPIAVEVANADHHLVFGESVRHVFKRRTEWHDRDGRGASFWVVRADDPHVIPPPKE